VKWGNKAHNALGNFLHEPTIADFKAGKDSSDGAARKKAQEIIDELDGILKATLFNVNFGQFVSFSCSCGFAIRRKAEVLDPTKPVVCGGCGRQYVYEPRADETMHAFHPDRFEYECESCHQKAFVDAHTIAKLPTVVCDCGAKAKVSIQYILTTIVTDK
jgi:DNA-directed RNA polymerase subunit RPC12/RpoP